MKKLFSTMAVAAALFAGYSAYNSTEDSELVNIALMNVEALAQAEGVTSGSYVSFDFADKYWHGSPNSEYNWFPKFDDCRINGKHGHQVYCNKGDGNCWNGTDCIKD